MAKKKTASAPTPTPSEPTSSVTGQTSFQRADDLIARYSNNVRFELTVHDLKLIFGESDQGTGVEVIRQHTTITMPWSVAKLMRYYLGINMLFHELYVGKIVVAPPQIPLPFPEPSQEAITTDSKATKAFELANKMREEFLASNTI